MTPSDRHSGNDKVILENRKRVYEIARTKNPSRWSRETRNWKKIEEVYLNYLHVDKKIAIPFLI